MPTNPRRRTARRYRPLALEPIEPRRMLAFGAELVADVDDTPRSPTTYPQHITEFNGAIVYSARIAATGDELWQSDGTKAGTRLIKDIVPGKESSRPQFMTNVNGTVYFSADTPANGRELWRSDGTEEGTYLLKGIRAGQDSSNPEQLLNVNGTLFFTADDGVHGRELWKSDGTKAGTQLVKDVQLGAAGSIPRHLASSNGLVFFMASDPGSNQLVLWRSDGTSTGTQPLSLVDDADPFRHTATDVNGTLFFVAKSAAMGRELWRTDGTSEGTRLVLDLRPGPGDSIDEAGFMQFLNFGGTLFFGANDGVHGFDLWKTDGTPSGTTLVKDLAGAAYGYGPSMLSNANGTLYFIYSRNELWKSDGTTAGTVQVFDFGDGNGAGQLENVGDTLYFSANKGDGYELWKSDGTQGGTLQVKDIRQGLGSYGYQSYSPRGSFPHSFHGIGGTVVFAASDVNGRHLWTTDGTEAGTRLMDDIDQFTASSRVQQLYNFNGQLLFSAGEELVDETVRFATWISDGTPGGTAKLATTFGQGFATVGNTAYFGGPPISSSGASSGRELWKTDGTAAGTVLIADINPHTGRSHSFPFVHEFGSEPSYFTEINGKVLFAAISKPQDYTKQLWITDGAAEGTAMLKDITVGSPGIERTFIKLGPHIYFAARESGGDYQLWRTDGTEPGTVRVKEIVSADNQPNRGVQDLTLMNGTMFFSATAAGHGRELWRSNGTAAGTVMVRDIRPGPAGSFVDQLVSVNGTLFFTTTKDNVQSLWRSDGTTAGTVFVADVGIARDLTNANGTLFFSSNRAAKTGHELWRSDGTAAGTRLVKDLVPGTVGSRPEKLQGINGVLFFEATLPSGKRGFWISNGTAAGTHQIVPGGTGLTEYQHLTNVNGTLYFAGTDAVHGQELWKLTTAHPSVQFSGTINYKENDPLRLIAPFAGISDADNIRFSGGRLSVVVQQNAIWADRVEIRNQGNGPGQIGVSGRWIRFGGEVIGSIRTGLPGSQLIIDLNARATVAATQALLRNVGYRNTSDNPSTKPRTVTVQLTDGSGGISPPLSKTINVQAVNDPPRLVLGGQIAYKNNSPAILLAPNAAVSDVDSANFLGGMLTVEVMSARGPSNRLWVSGAFTLQGDCLLRNGVLVGSVVENGFGWNALKLRFSAKMTPPLVQELVRSLRFRTFDNTNLDPRTIEFKLTDGDGGLSTVQTKTVNLTS